MHYRSHCKSHAPVKLAKEPGFDLGRLLDEIMRELFDERLLSGTIREKLWAKYYDYFIAAVDVGYSPSFAYYSKELAANLMANMSLFSAFKARSFEKSLFETLWNNGGVLSWSEFKKAGAAVNQDYNKRWLKTEYHQTVATANMAGKWQDFERTKDMYPNLRYVTVGDERVRAQHREWDGTVLPIDHPWWKSNYPPNDWGCRCDVERTDDPPSRIIPDDKQLKIEFKNNAAQSGKIFEKSAYEEHLNENERKEAMKGMSLNEQKNTVKHLVKELKKNHTGSIETKNLGAVLINKIGIEKTQNINSGDYVLQLDALNEIRNIKKYLNAFEGKVVIEKPRNLDKTALRPTLEGYLEIQVGDWYISLEKDRALEQDFKFYYIKKVSRPKGGIEQ